MAVRTPKQTVEPELTDAMILAMLTIGKQKVSTFATVDRQLSQAWRDPTSAQLYVDGEFTDDDDSSEIQTDVPVGPTNGLQINSLTKVSAVTIAAPDLFVRSETSEAVEAGRKHFRKEWKSKNWRRPASKSYLKRVNCGLGLMFYRWDAKRRSIFEQVHSWDFAVDPCVEDWQNLEWAFRRMRMSARKASRLFGKEHFADKASDEAGAQDKKRVELWCFWHRELNVEAVVYGGKVIKRGKNLYGRVPCLALEGDIDPGPSSWPLGDGQLAAGAQQELADVTTAISNIAKHGGPLNLVHEKLLTKTFNQAIQDGKEQGWIPVKELPARAYMRVPAEDVTTALLEARRQAQQALDAVTGVSGPMRGAMDDSVRFATQAAVAAQQGGSRTTQARTEYELFLDQMFAAALWMEVEFGGPRKDDGGQETASAEEINLWELLQQIEEITVVEASTVYRDPAQDQQQSMQLLQLTQQMVPLLVGLGLPAGTGLRMTLRLLQDTLRAFGRYNMDEYLPGLPQLLEAIDSGQLQPPPAEEAGGKGPKTPAETISYKDAPPDVRRQIEMQAGLQPSQVGDAPEGDGGEAEIAEAQTELATHQADNQTKLLLESSRQAHERQLLQMKLDQERELKLIELQIAEQNAARQAENQRAIASESNAAKLEVHEKQREAAAGRKPKAGASE